MLVNISTSTEGRVRGVLSTFLTGGTGGLDWWETQSRNTIYRNVLKLFEMFCRYYNYTLSNNGKEEYHKDNYTTDYLTDVIRLTINFISFENSSISF